MKKPQKKPEHVRIRSLANNVIELSIEGVIGYWDDLDDVDGDYFVETLAQCASMGYSVKICIDSIGGSYIQGLRIAEAIKSYPYPITTLVEGRADSIASLIAMSAPVRQIANTAGGMMIHKPWAEDVSGTAEQLREVATWLDEITAIYADDYLRLTGVDVSAYLDGTDHFFTPQECIDLGFMDEMVDDPEIVQGQYQALAARKRPAAKLAKSLSACIQARKAMEPKQFDAEPKPGTARAAAILPEPQPQRSTIMAENATTAAPAPAAPVDAQAIQAKAIADIQARNKDFIDTGKAYAKWGGEALAMQAVAEGWNREQLTSALMKAMAAGPAHPTYGQGARTEDNGDDANSRGFQSLGEFAYQVRSAALSPGRIDQRLVRAAATTFAGEDAGADGGFSVPPQFANEIVSLAMQEQSLLAMANDVPVQGNSMRFPKDETTPWGSDGVIATWDGEGDVIAQRKPVIGRSDLFLHRLTVLVPASDELLEDSMAMSAHLQRKMSEAVLWKTNDAIVNGTGAGQPLGIMTAASTVSQDKETSQTAKTITFPNVTKMYGRCIKGAGANLAWLVHPDAINQIYLLTNGTQSIWTPPVAGAKEAPNGYLLGRPIVETDACQTLGAVGDIILANMAGYRAITKAGGAQFAQSMHLYFDQNMQAFRLVFRMDGQPQLAKAVSPKNGSSTRSHFVTLAVRS